MQTIWNHKSKTDSLRVVMYILLFVLLYLAVPYITMHYKCLWSQQITMGIHLFIMQRRVRWWNSVIHWTNSPHYICHLRMFFSKKNITTSLQCPGFETGQRHFFLLHLSSKILHIIWIGAEIYFRYWLIWQLFYNESIDCFANTISENSPELLLTVPKSKDGILNFLFYDIQFTMKHDKEKQKM